MYTKERFNYSATKVRGRKAKIVCPVFDNAKYPFHGLGIKLGDPFALTYKFYANKNFSFVADFGKAASGLYNRYYREAFDDIVVRDTFSTSEAYIIPITHKVNSDFVGELKFLYHIDATSITPGLQLYVGGGWEWKSTRITYDYSYNNGLTNQPDEFGRFTTTRQTMGPQAVVGIEYAYFQLPISAFMELEYFSDVQIDPGWSRIEGGVGLRYLF